VRLLVRDGVGVRVDEDHINRVLVRLIGGVSGQGRGQKSGRSEEKSFHLTLRQSFDEISFGRRLFLGIKRLGGEDRLIDMKLILFCRCNHNS
jgi:hypothetical protein